MPIQLPHQLSSQEIRVLQEYRRLNAESLPFATLTAIRHPAGGGETPVVTLVDKGFLEADAARENFALTAQAKDFLAIEAKPFVSEAAPGGAATASNPKPDGA